MCTYQHGNVELVLNLINTLIWLNAAVHLCYELFVL